VDPKAARQARAQAPDVPETRQQRRARERETRKDVERELRRLTPAQRAKLERVVMAPEPSP
jgi:hypothetical protein